MSKLVLPELGEWTKFDLYTYLISNELWIPKKGDIVRTGLWADLDGPLPDIEYKVTYVAPGISVTGLLVKLEPCGTRCPCCLRHYPSNPMATLDPSWIQPYEFRTAIEWYFAMQQMVVDHVMR